MDLSSLLERTAIFILAVPIVLLLTTKLAWYRSFIALTAYFVIGFIYALLDGGFIATDRMLVRNMGILVNLLDAPLTLLFLTYLSRTSSFRKKIYWVIGAFIAYEVVVLLIYGYNIKASNIFTIPGLILTLSISVMFAVHQIKISVIYHKAAGKALFASALFFGYVGYTYCYFVYYFLDKTYQHDARLAFNAMTIISAILISIGIVFERKRVAKLFEIKTTREELKALYANEETKTIAPLEAIVFNMETHWKRETGWIMDTDKKETRPTAPESL